MEIKRNLSDDVEVGARPPVQNRGGGGGGGGRQLLSTSQTCTFLNNQGWRTNLLSPWQVSIQRALITDQSVFGAQTNDLSFQAFLIIDTDRKKSHYGKVCLSQRLSRCLFCRTALLKSFQYVLTPFWLCTHHGFAPIQKLGQVYGGDVLLDCS